MHPQSTSAPKRAPHPIARSMPEADRITEAIREPYGYVRVSTILQRLKGYSLPKQLKAVAASAVADENPIALENLLGDADSGRKFERKGLQTLLTRAREGRVSVVYFAKVDRIGRNARDSLNIVHELKQLGVRMVVLEPRLDTDNPFGYFLFVILAAMAELEATFILERTMGGKLEKMVQDEQAGHAAGPGGPRAPYGLRYNAPTKKGQDGSWEIDADRAKWVRFIFKIAVQRKGGDAIADMLNKERAPSPSGKPWNDIAVRRIIRNPAYKGEMRRRMGGQEFTFHIEPTVEPVQWEMANAAMNANKILSRRNSKHEYLLASAKHAPLLRCRICHRVGREHMMGGRTRNDRPSHSDRNQYYECYHWQDGERVRHRVAAKRLEDAVWDALCAMIRDPELVLARFRQLSDHATREAQEITAKIAALSEAENENRLAQKRLIDMAARGRLAADLIEEQERNLAREAAEIASKKTLLETQLEQAAAGQAPLRDVQDACALLADGLLEAGFEEKQWLIRHLVQVIYADKEGWTLEGRLPGMRAEGSFTGGAIEGQSP